MWFVFRGLTIRLAFLSAVWSRSLSLMDNLNWFYGSLRSFKLVSIVFFNSFFGIFSPVLHLSLFLAFLVSWTILSFNPISVFALSYSFLVWYACIKNLLLNGFPFSIWPLIYTVLSMNGMPEVLTSLLF